MRILKNKTTEEWQIPNNPNGRIWKLNKSFKDNSLLKIINDLETNQRIGNEI